MKNYRFKLLSFALLAVFVSFNAVTAQTKKPVSPLKREIDRSKMNRGCSGNDLSVRREENGNQSTGSFVLTEPFDFAAMRRTALKNKLPRSKLTGY